MSLTAIVADKCSFILRLYNDYDINNDNNNYKYASWNLDKEKLEKGIDRLFEEKAYAVTDLELWVI